MIQVKNLTKAFGSVVAVNNISFTVQEGEIVGFLGPNGAGKSTTIKILTCFIPATGGEASIGGYDVFTQSIDVRRVVGYLPEGNPLYPEMRVREYLDFRGKLRHMPRDQRICAIQRVIDLCWLGDFIDRPIGQLSKGMRQRVGLADALLHNPKVLILDEPTVGLDPNQIRETRKLITELGKRHTIILCSHILPEVEAVCSRTIIIAGGQIRASGTINEVRERIKGTSRLLAEVKGPKTDVEAAIRQIDGVKNVESTANEGWNRLRIESSNRRDLREEIATAVTRQNWPLRELRLEVGSLEEFFIQITAEAAAVSRA
ncbi:MAG: ATP-binding cassette domain-containing protein [Phycisphaerales bacterium]|nr:ATP-binding cassette domain-containing protein [Phycisphaerales bacterium]